MNRMNRMNGMNRMNRKTPCVPSLLPYSPRSFSSPGGNSSFCEIQNLPSSHRLTRNALLAETRCHKAEDLCHSLASSLCTPQPELFSMYGVIPLFSGGSSVDYAASILSVYGVIATDIGAAQSAEGTPVRVLPGRQPWALTRSEPPTTLRRVTFTPTFINMQCQFRSVPFFPFRIPTLSFRVTFTPSFYFRFFSYPTFRVSFSLPSTYERYL